MKSAPRQRLTGAIAVGVILVCCVWIYFTQIKTVQHNVALHRHIGEVLAEQSAALVGKKGRIVAIAIETREWPELKTQLDAFKTRLKQLGAYQVREYELDPKDQPKYGVGTGLSGRRYVRTANKNPEADLFVSFVGAPKLTSDEVAQLKKQPKLIVESRSGDNLPGLFERGLVQVAVVSRFQFPSPGPENPKTPEEWFNKRYQVLTAELASKMSKSE